MRGTSQTTGKWASVAMLAISFGALAITAAPAEERSFAEVRRGKALVDAGDCVACHTQAGAQPFTGGRPIETPFGVIYSPNITPDRETGIGAWSDDDFYRALHEGIGPDGARLYPAFPYPYFTRMPREDVMAIRAYLNTLPPARNPRPENKLIWPLGHRVFMRAWNLMFFKPHTFTPDNARSAEWNRGAYLVEGPGHCGACHTPKNMLGGDKSGEALRGGAIQNWFAPNITDDQHHGVGSWSIEDIVEYLKTGRNARSGAAALMSEVVRDSTSKMSDGDLRAIAVYLKDDRGKPEEKPPAVSEQSAGSAGKAIYADSCSGCHRSDGTGVPQMFPPLAKNANVQSSDPTTLIHIILEGAQTAATNPRPTPSTMPSYGWKLTNDGVAAVATYVRNAWGNAAPKVTADQVDTLRRNLKATTQ